MLFFWLCPFNLPFKQNTDVLNFNEIIIKERENFDRVKSAKSLRLNPLAIDPCEKAVCRYFINVVKMRRLTVGPLWHFEQ